MVSFLAKNKNDIIYLALLLASVAIGPYYRSIPSVKLKKWIGTCIGIILIIISSGYNSLHPFISVGIGLLTIKITTIR